MHLLASRFVIGRSMEEALRRAATGDAARYRYSFDMLGEAAITRADAARYGAAYADAIVAAGKTGGGDLLARHGVSVKLSALHPRFEYAQRKRALPALAGTLADLAALARRHDVPLTVDAEEAHRLELTLEVFRETLADPRLAGWDGLGLAVQAYQKRAPVVLDWLAELADTHHRLIPVRLVKGAYWDYEIKRAQQLGLPGYPVYTRKAHTDVAFLACARRLLAARRLYPQFATHNAHTVAAVLHLAGGRPFEFQRLYGMGEALYAQILAEGAAPCRVYAPVGGHRELLPYLVRRLLENGANASFVHRFADPHIPVEALASDPVTRVHARGGDAHPRIPLPEAIYGEERRNSRGIALDNARDESALYTAVRAQLEPPWHAAPLIDGEPVGGPERAVTSPHDRRCQVGTVVEADEDTAARAMDRAAAGARAWAATALAERARALRRAADLFETNYPLLIALCVREGGRTLPDALADVREAVDYLRYYATLAAHALAPRSLPGPTGEENVLLHEGRGVFACISPWNFPVAIFTGQIAAALVAGNAVVAKPAHQTPLVGMQICRLLHEAGIPPAALHYLPGPSSVVAAAVLNHPRLAGVLFTGSTATAKHIHRALAARDGPLLPLTAETGGINAMIVDSSALPEQVVMDVLRSAFNSAGQRCSALRLLCLQEECADRFLELLRGALAELRVGDPLAPDTDVGPVIDEEARETLERHIHSLESRQRLIARADLPPDAEWGCYVAPCMFEIAAPDLLREEVFGPVLHVVRYQADRLDALVDAINGSGYGLTFGIHSRIDATARRVAARIHAGNVYVNRDIIGATVGAQPFGGRGLSGTGPKAGGPDYLRPLVQEKSVATNTAAVGGNARLLGSADDE
ncbi:MAG: bifunctional proline dehydrogenase/L-glutamate gamma-semialdehyde dehydrogenase PutA [Thiohalomonadaceae bacterium]